MSDIYILIASARNAYGLLHEHLGSWLSGVLTFVPEVDLRPVQVMQEVWTVIGLEPALVQVLAEDLRLCWRDGQLCLSEGWERLSGALLGIWQFKQFSDIRWVTVGSSCRRLIGALLSGF